MWHMLMYHVWAVLVGVWAIHIMLMHLSSVRLRHMSVASPAHADSLHASVMLTCCAGPHVHTVNILCKSSST